MTTCRWMMLWVGLMMSPALFAKTPMDAPWTSLGVYQSLPGQTLDQFVLDIAPVLDAHTRQTGHEVCGLLSQSDSVFAIRLGTSHAQLGCLIRRSHVPRGFVSIELSVHSHSRSGVKTLSKNDMFWMRTSAMYAPRQMYLRLGPSQVDRKGLPGYLVENQKVYYFDKTQTRLVEEFEQMSVLQNQQQNKEIK